MKEIIAEVSDKLKENLEKLFKSGNYSLDSLESELLKLAKEAAAEVSAAYQDSVEGNEDGNKLCK